MRDKMELMELEKNRTKERVIDLKRDKSSCLSSRMKGAGRSKALALRSSVINL
jgi:hypothetical protein